MTTSANNLSVDCSVLYQKGGKKFVDLFLKSEPVRYALFSVLEEWEKEWPYEPDEKISDYVSKLNLEPKQTRLLARTLKMIKIITE